MKTLTIRLPEQELDILKAYCELKERSQTDILREFIRNLEDAVQDPSHR